MERSESGPGSARYSRFGLDVRRKHNLQRRRLQRKGTKGAKKKLRRVSQNEARFRRQENHRISKAIVETAKRTGRGIACEDLAGIRGRVTARGGDARNRLSGWSFHQLYSFLAYKARIAGVPVVQVDPASTSQTCPECGHCERSNRRSQSEFRCQRCHHEQHADVVALATSETPPWCKPGLRPPVGRPQNWTTREPRVEPESPSL